MAKGRSGKHSSQTGKHPNYLSHHTGKWAVVAVRFPREMAKKDRAFDNSIRFLVPIEVAPHLRAQGIAPEFAHPGQWWIRQYFYHYVSDGFAQLRLSEFKTFLEITGVNHSDPKAVKFWTEQSTFWQHMAKAMANFHAAVLRRIKRVRRQTEH